MKATSLAVLLSVFVLCSVVSAQDYQIRTDAKVNLRATYNLQGNIVETVPSGTILQVVGMFNRWLKINRNGNELWLADWVSYTRVADGGQTQSRTETQTQSQIDNCCYVDRQCHSDADWTSGYWAFQNNQCAAPLQSRLQISSQPANSSTGTSDNCCFLDWQCNSDDEWTRGYWTFQINQCDMPEGLIIEGSEDFVILVKDALQMLKTRAPEWFAYATSGLDKIILFPEGDILGVNVATRTYSMTPDDAFLHFDEGDVITMASRMVHEACHVYRYEAGLPPGGYEGETACLQVQIEATEVFEVLETRRRLRRSLALGLRHVLENIDNPMYQWWH